MEADTACQNRIPLLRKIISGGQTGVDRAALDAAIEFGIAIGGWCPKGRRANDGVIPAHYPLTETHGRSYPTRTKWNVRDSDATLIICRDEPEGGTALTIKYCEQLAKPYFIYQLEGGTSLWVDSPEDPGSVVYWLNCNAVRALNVAGPSEGRYCQIYSYAYAFMCAVLQWQNREAYVMEPGSSVSVHVPELTTC